MKLQIGVLACLCLQALATFPNESVLRQYAEKKVWKSCIGDNIAEGMYRTVAQAVHQCKTFSSRPINNIGVPPPIFQSPRPFIVTTAGPSGSNFRRPNIIQPTIQKRQPLIFAVLDDLPFTARANNGLSSRSKRQVSDFMIQASELLASEERIRERVSNFTCILTALDLIDERGQVKFSKMGDEINSMNINEYLKQDLLKVLQTCASVTTCLPQERNPLIPSELMGAVAFFKCAKMKRQIACMKNDVRQYLKDGSRGIINPNVDIEQIVDRILTVKMVDEENEEIQLLM